MVSAEVHLPRAMSNVTMRVRITGQRSFAMRVWLAVRIMKVAARVLGCNLDVDAELIGR